MQTYTTGATIIKIKKHLHRCQHIIMQFDTTINILSRLCAKCHTSHIFIDRNWISAINTTKQFMLRIATGCHITNMLESS